MWSSAKQVGSASKHFDRARQYDDGIHHAEVAPRMPAGPADGHLKAPAAEGFGDDRVRSGAVDHQRVLDGVAPMRVGKQVPHPANVAFALFADVSDEDYGQNRLDAASL